MAKKCQLVWPINVGHFSDVWFLIEKREETGHIFVRDQWISSTLKNQSQTIPFGYLNIFLLFFWAPKVCSVKFSQLNAIFN